MKYCPICFVSYPSEQTSCSSDGARLAESKEWTVGSLIRGRYRILAKIGEGGMGIVYKAEHIVLEEVRALKVMDPQLSRDPKLVKRFQQEARVARRLRHPNVVHVDDIDQAEDGNLFIAMEYVDGPNLKQFVDANRGSLSVERTLKIGRGIAEALSALHVLGLVHRDVKPTNILLARDPHGEELPKLLDFGIASLKESPTLTGTTWVMTPSCAAPEQWQGLKGTDLDGRTDLYALGMTLYEMLAGRLPFQPQTLQEWMYCHLTQVPPPPSQFNPRLKAHSGLDDFILKLLAKERAHRPPNAQAVLTELRKLEEAAIAVAEIDRTLPIATRLPHRQPTGRPVADRLADPPVVSRAPIVSSAPSPPARDDTGRAIPTPIVVAVPSARDRHGRPLWSLTLWGGVAAGICGVAIYFALGFMTQPPAVDLVTSPPPVETAPVATPSVSAPIPPATTTVPLNPVVEPIPSPPPSPPQSGIAASPLPQPPAPAGTSAGEAPVLGTAKPPRPAMPAATEPVQVSAAEQAAAERRRRQIDSELRRAGQSLDAGAYEEAASAYEKVLTLDPQNAGARGGLDKTRRAKAAEDAVFKRLKRPGSD